MNRVSKIYIVMTLVISWLTTFILFYFGILESFVPLIMLVPGVVTFFLRIIFYGLNQQIFKSSQAKGFFDWLRALLFAFVFPIIVVSVCAIVGAVLYGEPLDGQFFQTLWNHQWIGVFFLSALGSLSTILAFGEEYGWRAFLLPELCKSYSRVKATTMLGIIWALYHFPVLLLLNGASMGVLRAFLLACLQGLAAFTFSYAFAYCYFISNRVYPTVVLHAFWNLLNPYLLGSIYTGRAGVVFHNAPVAVVNGEGILGIIVGVLFSVFFIFSMNQQDKMSNVL